MDRSEAVLDVSLYHALIRPWGVDEVPHFFRGRPAPCDRAEIDTRSDKTRPRRPARARAWLPSERSGRARSTHSSAVKTASGAGAFTPDLLNSVWCCGPHCPPSLLDGFPALGLLHGLRHAPRPSAGLGPCRAATQQPCAHGTLPTFTTTDGSLAQCDRGLVRADVRVRVQCPARAQAASQLGQGGRLPGRERCRGPGTPPRHRRRHPRPAGGRRRRRSLRPGRSPSLPRRVPVREGMARAATATTCSTVCG